MSCPLRRCEGSGFHKPADPALAAANDTALNALLAARAEHDARLAGFWTAAAPKPETKSSTPESEVFIVDGHYHRVPDPMRAHKLHDDIVALRTANEEYDSKMEKFWKEAGVPKPETTSSTPGADVVEVDGHHYRFDNPGNAEKVQEALAKLLADRGYQNTGAPIAIASHGTTSATSHHYFATAPSPGGEPIAHVGGGFRPASSVRPRASEPASATGGLRRR